MNAQGELTIKGRTGKEVDSPQLAFLSPPPPPLLLLLATDMISAIRSSPAIRAKERIVAWLLLLLHTLVLALSVLLLLSPNNVFSRQSGLASVELNTSALFALTPDGWIAPRQNASRALQL